jgi:hypothetical protein
VTPDGADQPRCQRHAIGHGPVVRRAVRVALVVGSLLFLINQADVVLGGDATAFVYFKSALTFFVPYGVSTYSALQINRL